MSQNNENKHFYLPQLSGLRFFAFVMVFFVHAPQFRIKFGPDWLIEFSKWINERLAISLNFGVDLFFVLSAFLITKLLLLEYERKGSFSVKNFLIRRVLRIAPLYYAYLAISLLIFPFITNDPVIAAFGTPQFKEMIHTWLLPSLIFTSNNIGFPPNLGAHLWSISIEMQVYLTLPFLIHYFVSTKTSENKLKGILIILGSLFVITILMMYSSILLNPPYPKTFLSSLTRLEPFIIGVLVAIVNQYRPNSLKIPFQLPIFFALLSLNLVLPSPFTANVTSPLVYIVNSIAFGLLLNYLISYKSRLSQLLAWKPFAFLGELTFGLYVFHYPVIHFIKQLFTYLNWPLPIKDEYWLYFMLISGAITLILALISYYFFELRFLKLKNKFTTVGKNDANVRA